MAWIKKGLLIQPKPKFWWNKSHNMLPTVVHHNNNYFYVYFSGRDNHGRSQIGRSLIQVINSDIILIETDSEPIFQNGERGCFDDNGVTPSSVQDNFFYYIGWNSGTTTYRMSLIMGLAIFNNKKLYRNSRAPLLKRTDREPFGISTAPFVLKIKSRFKMWYVSGEKWINKDLPVYNIKFATSINGVDWDNKGIVSLELEKNETALARPCVLYDGNIYEMYFSYKDPKYGYRIGYATSKDGVQFTRSSDKSHYLNTSENGWDSQMVEYSYVFEYNSYRFMLYNGNGYGANGIGYAVKE